MTRKDYVLIAAALADSRPRPSNRGPKHHEIAIEVWGVTREAIAQSLSRDNAEFDIARFIKATEQ